MSGAITTLGVGSGLELQNILEQLREADQAVVDRKEDDIVTLQAQMEEFTVVKNKLLTMKSAALNLSLSGNFLGRNISSSDEDTLTATVQDGAEVQGNTIVVSNLATQSSWLSDSGFAETESIVYVPTSQESTSGVTTSTIGTGSEEDFITEAGTMTITFGDSSTIDVTVTDGMKIDDLVTAINGDAENVGAGANGQHVWASTFVKDDQTYLRVESDTAGGTGETNRVAISGLTNTSFEAPDKAFAYQVNDETVSVNVAGDTTLAQLMALINDDSDNPGVTASVINDGIDPDNPYRLVVKADNTGEDYRISFLSQLPDITMSENADQAVANSLNSQFSVDGLAYQRQSNSISDVFSGVGFTLQGAGTSSISVSRNDESLTEMINTLIDAYNDVSQELSAKSGYDSETEEFGVLSGTTLRDLPFELQNLMTSIIKSDDEGNVETLFDLGLEFGRDGQISIDQEELAEAIKDNRSSVEAFFLGDSDEEVTGFADKINDRLRFLTGGLGILDGEKNSAQDRINGLEVSIEAATARLDKKYEILTKQFIDLDSYMNRMTSMSSYLTSQFDSLSGLSGSKNK